jgi:hypothetical protein
LTQGAGLTAQSAGRQAISPAGLRSRITGCAGFPYAGHFSVESSTMSIFSSAAVRALAPHLVDLVKGALPLFTPEREAAEAPPEQVDNVQQRQISELQQAATLQATAIREMAERGEASMRALEAELAKQKRMTQAALAVAVVAALLAVWALLH